MTDTNIILNSFIEAIAVAVAQRLNQQQQQPQSEPETWLTTEETARYLKVTSETIRRMIKEGTMPAINLSNGIEKACYRISKTELIKYLKEKRKA